MKRALALFQLGMDKQAEDEFLNFYVKTNETNRRGLLDFAEDNDLTDLSSAMVSITGQVESSEKANKKVLILRRTGSLPTVGKSKKRWRIPLSAKNLALTIKQ